MEKRTLKLGIAVICLFFLIIGFYELVETRRSIEPLLDLNEKGEAAALDGYEEEEDLLRYIAYQIQNSNLEAALRGCAVQDLADYFSLDYYIRYLDRFEGTELIPPSDTGSPAYKAIAKAELAYDYAMAIREILKFQQKTGKLSLFGIQEDVPDNPDGMYYQNREKVCEILGARSVSEYILYLGTETQMYELRCTLARYKKYWKVLSFHSLNDMGTEEVDLTESTKERGETVSLEEYAEAVLPQNYDIINDCAEEDIEFMLERFFLYLQREDALSAMAYMDIYRNEGDFDGTSRVFRRQGEAAANLQKFYYRILLLDEDYYDWMMRDLTARSGELVTQLSTTNMLFTDLKKITEVKNDGTKAIYEVKFLYNNAILTRRVSLYHRTGGWKIQSINN